LRDGYGSPQPQALYCCVDPNLYRPRNDPERWDLSYLGTYSPDRQPTLDRLLLEPARRRPDLRFVVAGSLYPDDISWPSNVERFEHVGPQDHPEFYGSSRWTLNVTRADMVRAGYSPSVRLFEAAACGIPIVSDLWDGIETVLTPGESILLAPDTDAVLSLLDNRDQETRDRIAGAARRQVLSSHTAAHRAAELEAALLQAAARPRAPEVRARRVPG
jgi:spore maturation protein CgeB